VTVYATWIRPCRKNSKFTRIRNSRSALRCLMHSTISALPSRMWGLETGRWAPLLPPQTTSAGCSSAHDTSS